MAADDAAVKHYKEEPAGYSSLGAGARVVGSNVP